MKTTLNKSIMGLVLLLLSTTAFPQPKQLSNWFCTPSRLDLRSTIPVASTTSGAPTPALTGYNSWYEAGILQFYVVATANGGIIYNSSHVQIGQLSGTTPVGNEISIFPHTDNFRTLCIKKYWIIYHVKTSGTSGSIQAGLLDVNAASNMFTSGVYTFGSTSNPTECPFAVGKMDVSGNRALYMQLSSSVGLSYFQHNGTTFSLISSNNSYVTAGAEMELTNAGNKLAFVEPSGNVRAINVSPGFGTSIANLSGFTSVRGLEFDNAGSKLFFSASNGPQGAGVYVRDLSSNTTSFIWGSTAYGSGMLEKSLNNTTITTQIICGNATTVAGIDQGSTLLNTWTASFPGVVMPDQVDGEDLDDKIFWLGFPPRSRCVAGNITTTINYHPYLLNFGSNFNILVQNIGNYAGVYAPANFIFINNLAVGAFGLSVYLSATTSYRYTLYNTSNTNCKIAISYSAYLWPCASSFTLQTSTSPSLPHGRVTATPNDPDGEEATPGFGQAWYVQELDPDNYMPNYTISDPSCWHTYSSTPDQTFPGFDPENNTYEETVTSVDCGIGDGLFLYGKDYLVSRATWSATQDWTLSSELVHLEPEESLVQPSQSVDRTRTDIRNQNAAVKSAAAKHALGQVQIYPNPASGILNIKTNLPENGMIELYDITGRKLRELAAGNKELTSSIDISDLTKGIYLVKINIGNELRVQHVMIW